MSAPEPVVLPPLDPIKHPLRDEAERAWIAGYAKQGILSYSKSWRPPSPFAQFLQGYVAGHDALLRERDALAALLKEARFFVPSHDDVAIRIDAALARIDAALKARG